MSINIINKTFYTLFIFVFHVSFLSANINILNLNPDSNYRLSKDTFDMDDLADKKINKYPIWTKKSSVGWQFKTPVMIQVGINTKCQKVASGVVSIHTARGSHADVNLPRRVDVYSKIGLKGYKHIKGINIDNSLFADRSNHWIDVKVSNVGDEVMIVVHANGQFLMIDEVTFKLSNCSFDNDVHVDDYIPVNDVIKDSVGRLKTSLNKSILVDFDDLESNKIYLWDAPIWERLNNDFPILNMDDNNISIVGVRGEYESFNIGLFSTYKLPLNIEIAVKGAYMVIDVRELKSIIASNGKKVWDPLLPVKNNTVVLKHREKQYLWFTVNASVLEPGSHELTLKISDIESGFEYTKVVEIEIIANKMTPSNTPQVVTWSYTHHVPVKENLNAAIKDQKNHGVNTFVIHPSKIPSPLKRNHWTNEGFSALRKEIMYYKGNGLILLHLGWPQWLEVTNKSDLLNKKEKIKDWVEILNNKMNEYGINQNDWALYPFDEPINEKIEFLKVIAPWVKEVDAGIQLYANPIQTYSKSPVIQDLVYLEKYIDFWQPNIRLAKGDGKHFFSNLKKDWWVYGGPVSPVKAAMPFEYRKLSWDAWSVGAKGTGFWSYSDTNKSSAWDDFDGTRADWSVVYESSEGPISSRRWEAFRDGIEDFKLLLHLNDITNAIDKNDFELKSSNIDMNVLLKERAKLIDRYKASIKNSTAIPARIETLSIIKHNN